MYHSSNSYLFIIIITKIEHKQGIFILYNYYYYNHNEFIILLPFHLDLLLV